jgi:hypothetical protein
MPTYREEILQALADKGALCFNRIRLLALTGAKDYELLAEADNIDSVLSKIKTHLDLFQTEKKNETS